MMARDPFCVLNFLHDKMYIIKCKLDRKHEKEKLLLPVLMWFTVCDFDADNQFSTICYALYEMSERHQFVLKQIHGRSVAYVFFMNIYNLLEIEENQESYNTFKFGLKYCHKKG